MVTMQDVSTGVPFSENCTDVPDVDFIYVLGIS